MGTLRKKTVSRGAWLIDYVTRDKAFNGPHNPRVLAIDGLNCSVLSAARDFARIRRQHDVDPARNEVHGFVFSWGLDELNPSDPEDVAKAMAVVKRFFDRLPPSAALMVAQGDGKGADGAPAKLHVHGVVSNVVLEDRVVNGQGYRAGSALGGKAFDIEWMRQQFDECNELEGVTQTLLPYEKGDRRSGLDAAARRAGKQTNADKCKDAVEDVIATSGARPNVDELSYELAARGIELRVTPKVSGKHKGQTWLAFRPEGAAGWTRDVHMGLERYGHDAIMAGLRSPSKRKARTVNPFRGEAKPTREVTPEERAESAKVVDELAQSYAARRLAEQVLDEARTAESGDEVAAHYEHIETADFEASEGSAEIPAGNVDPEVGRERVVNGSSVGSDSAAVPGGSLVNEETGSRATGSGTSLQESAHGTGKSGSSVGVELRASGRHHATDHALDAELELLRLRHLAITEGSSWTDEEADEALARMDELKAALGIPEDETPTAAEVIAEYEERVLGRPQDSVPADASALADPSRPVQEVTTSASAPVVPSTDASALVEVEVAEQDRSSASAPASPSSGASALADDDDRRWASAIAKATDDDKRALLVAMKAWNAASRVTMASEGRVAVIPKGVGPGWYGRNGHMLDAENLEQLVEREARRVEKEGVLAKEKDAEAKLTATSVDSPAHSIRVQQRDRHRAERILRETRIAERNFEEIETEELARLSSSAAGKSAAGQYHADRAMVRGSIGD